MKDSTFGEDYLDQWRRVFPYARVQTFPESGHFALEEASAVEGPLIEGFVASHRQPGAVK